MKISLENWLRNKLHENESMLDYAVATDTVRCWIDEYKELKEQSLPRHQDGDMKTLQAIKDEVAREKGWSNFESFLTGTNGTITPQVLECDINRIAKRYAQQVGEQVRKDAAENAEVENCYGDYIVDKQSILTTEIKLP